MPPLNAFSVWRAIRYTSFREWVEPSKAAFHRPSLDGVRIWKSSFVAALLPFQVERSVSFRHYFPSFYRRHKSDKIGLWSDSFRACTQLQGP
jgi:hypothetical protein